jgi:hypothetical protein
LCGAGCGVSSEEVIPGEDTGGGVDIIDEENNNVGSISLGNSTITLVEGGFLIISAAKVSTDTDVSQVVSSIIDVTLLDANGNEISLLDNSVRICLEVNSTDTQDLCLSYLDESVTPPKWRCQDPCLTRSNSSFICGETGHFTSFAVLLGGGGGDSCGGSSAQETLIQWLSLAAIIIALVCVVFLALLLELKVRLDKKRREEQNEKKRRTRRTRVHPSSTGFSMTNTDD